MHILYSVFMTITFLGVLPLILGQIWRGVIRNDGVVFTYLSGFFTILAIFEIVAVPMTFLFVSLHIQVVIFSMVFIMLSAFVIYRKHLNVLNVRSFLNEYVKRIRTYFISFTRYEWIYFVILLVLLGFELYFTLFYDIGAWRSDDGFYVVVSSSAIYDDGFYLTDATIGNYLHVVPIKYGLCGIYTFYAYIAIVTELGVAIIEQTVCAGGLFIMSYGAYYLLAKLLFKNDEERDNRMVFLILLSLAFLFGLHSQYSLTFRLFGPIWQGKAILAVVVTPFLLAVYPQILSEEIRIKEIIFLVIMSFASICLTLGGVIVMGVIPGILTVLSCLHEKKIQYVKYLPAVWVAPLFNMVVYLIFR